jgi:hypothetical protein
VVKEKFGISFLKNQETSVKNFDISQLDFFGFG